MNIFDVIKYPIITEKSVARQAIQQYAFAVNARATKYDVRGAVEELFKVHVVAVRTLKVPGKQRRVGRSVGQTSSWKKAIVTLKEGERIEFAEAT